jgi:Cu(I)/Ag(I) efflux system membrane fusion protein
METMEIQQRSAPRLLLRLVLVALGVGVGVALATAHFTGRLNPLYHQLGFHALHGGPDQSEGGEPATSGAHAGHAGHAGHSGMSLPQVGSGEPSRIPGYAVVQISPERQQLIGVRTGTVTKDRLLMSIRAVGIIEPDQTRLARIQTRISGWVTKVHANFVGQNVKQGDPLLEIYSPDLLSTQEEYLIALDGHQQALANSARRRLELWGVPPDEIKQLEKTKKARETLMLRAPISGRVLERTALEGTRVEPTMELYRIADLSVVWLQAKIYEYELPHVEIGQPVRISLVSRPETEFQSKVAFVEPVLQEATRTVKVRVVLDNPKDEFRPGMYADLWIQHDMGTGLLVPESALLRTGERNLAFRVLPGGRFEPLEVKVGARFGERLQVLAGLSEGERVVTSAGFLIDAESRLKSAVSAMGGHQHGAGATKSSGSKDTAAPSPDGGTQAKPSGGQQHEAAPAKAGDDHHHHH